MKQIVDKLNKIAKKINENVELSDRDLIIDSLDSITKAYGGTPNDSNLIVDKLEDIYNNISPAVSGNIEITENGENINVAPYATATVNVSGGSELADFVVVNNTSSQITVWCNKIDSNNCVIYAPETINANSQKTLKTTVSPDEKKASGFIEIRFGNAGTAVGKNVNVSNGSINFQANKPYTNPSGIVIWFEQTWLPSEAPILTVS